MKIMPSEQIKTDIQPVDTRFVADIQKIIDSKTKPQGSLGKLEALAAQLALIESNRLGQLSRNINISNPTVLVCAGDHGIASQGVSIAPSEVTQQMVLNFLSGGAAINCFSRSNQINLEIVNAGVLLDIPQQAIANSAIAYHDCLVANGTQDFSVTSAMTTEQVIQGLQNGAKVVEKVHATGCNIIGFGEMGIGNTSSAAAIMAVITCYDTEDCVGRGTGISDEQFARKQALIEKGLDRVKSESLEVVGLLREFGGHEIVAIVGAIIKACELKMHVIIDGFIVTAAALVAAAQEPRCSDYMIFSHCSEELGHRWMLEHLQADPLLTLGMRLGEGTGVALSVPLIRSAVSMYNDMASFEQAGIASV